MKYLHCRVDYNSQITWHFTYRDANGYKLIPLSQVPALRKSLEIRPNKLTVQLFMTRGNKCGKKQTIIHVFEIQLKCRSNTRCTENLQPAMVDTDIFVSVKLTSSVSLNLNLYCYFTLKCEPLTWSLNMGDLHCLWVCGREYELLTPSKADCSEGKWQPKKYLNLFWCSEIWF